MKRILLLALSLGASATLFALDYTYTWNSAARPTSILDGRVRFTYDSNGLISSIYATPDTNGKLIITGNPMKWSPGTNGSGCSVTNSADGAIVFQNAVTTSVLRVYSTSPNNDVYWRGYKTFLDANWVTVKSNFAISNYFPQAVQQYSSDGAGGTIGSWGNPDNWMWADTIKTNSETGVISFSYETDPQQATDSGTTAWVIKVVKMELRMNGANLQARALEAFQVWSKTSAKLERGFDIDELVLDDDAHSYSKKYNGIAYSKRSIALRTTSDLNGGYGINTLRFWRYNSCAMSTIRFEGPLSFQNNAIVASTWTRLEIADPSELGGTFYNWLADGIVSLKNGSYNWTGNMHGGYSGTMTFENEVSIEGDPYASEAPDTNRFLTSSTFVLAQNHHVYDIIPTPAFEPDPTMPNDCTVGKVYDPNYSWASMAGGSMGGIGTNATTGCANYTDHKANLFNLKPGTTTGTLTGQFQTQQGENLKCVYVSLTQSGGNILAKYGASSTYYVALTNKNLISDFGPNLMGLDFDKVKSNTTRYGARTASVATSGTISGFGIRDIHLFYNQPHSQFITATQKNVGTNADFIVSGLDDANMTLDLRDFGALSTNGTLTIKKGGTVMFGGSSSSAGTKGYVGGTCPIMVEPGGTIRQISSNIFGTTQDLTLDGGTLIGDYSSWNTASDLVCFLYTMKLRNGALITEYNDTNLAFRVGSITTSKWTIDGTSPSTNNVPLEPMSAGAGTTRTFTFDVSKTGDYLADFVQNGALVPYYGSVNYTNCAVAKIGDGTMLLTAPYKHQGMLSVTGGKFLLGGDNLWTGNANISLNGGTFGAIAGTSNNVSAITVGSAGAGFYLGKGSKLFFADCTSTPWVGESDVVITTETGDLEEKQLRFGNSATSLLDSQRRRIICNGVRIGIDEDGYATTKPSGLIYHIR